MDMLNQNHSTAGSQAGDKSTLEERVSKGLGL